MADIQPKKTRRVLKTQRKRVRALEKKERMMSAGGPANPDLSSNLTEPTERKFLEAHSSDGDNTSNEEMTEVEERMTELGTVCTVTESPQVLFTTSESLGLPQVLNDIEIETDPATPPHVSEFRMPDYCVVQAASPATQAQIDAMINFMAENLELARGQLRNTNGRVRSKRLWEGLCNALNSMGGCFKTVEQWQRVWADKKHLAKKAAVAANRSARAGGCPTVLSPMELRILSIMGEGNGERQTDARVPAFPAGPPINKQEPANSPPVTPADPLSEDQPAMSPEPLELVMPVLNQRGSRNMRNGVEHEEEDNFIPRRATDSLIRAEVLFKLEKAEKEWLVKAAREKYYKLKLEKETAEELKLCAHSKRMEADLRLAILRTQTDHF